MKTMRWMPVLLVCLGVWQTEAVADDTEVLLSDIRLEMTQRALAKQERALADLNAKRQQLIDQYGVSAINPDALVESARQTERQEFESDMQLRLMEVRRDAIVTQIDRYRMQMEHEIANDEIGQLHRDMLAKLNEQLEQLKTLHQNGQVSQSELLAKQNEITGLRVEMAQYRNRRARELSGDLLGELNHELAKLNIDRAVAEARKEMLAERNEQQKQMLRRVLREQEEVGQFRLEAMRQRKMQLNSLLHELDRKQLENRTRLKIQREKQAAEELQRSQDLIESPIEVREQQSRKARLEREKLEKELEAMQREQSRD